ncbi:hypothetical protein LB543_04685 [Mesorhizobium sp. ESP7-2]|uniref:hypothetical protein n=1 Tax=Mesorhizobium sp. ESP7-2 TaxID=2876622 RepID=UPI001CCABB13|nr:hypothetical protein [Mesorhizobium sp. ESP7-2]MBZ9706014.1 hypothetical protein [Mesorhizobium sp. ESP7-2]
MAIILIGALLTIAGLVYMAVAALRRGQLSGGSVAVGSDQPKPNLAMTGPTLEPPRRGLRFLGLSQHWPGLLMMAVGIIMLLSVAIL